MGLAHGPRDFELFFCNGVMADSLCTLVFVSSAGLGSREPSVRLFCSVNSVWLRWSQLWPVGSSVVSLEAQSLGSGPPCIPLGFFFFLLHNGLWALPMSALLGHPNPPGQSQGQAGCAGDRAGQGCAVQEAAVPAAAP